MRNNSDHTKKRDASAFSSTDTHQCVSKCFPPPRTSLGTARTGCLPYRPSHSSGRLSYPPCCQACHKIALHKRTPQKSTCQTIVRHGGYATKHLSMIFASIIVTTCACRSCAPSTLLNAPAVEESAAEEPFRRDPCDEDNFVSQSNFHH